MALALGCRLGEAHAMIIENRMKTLIFSLFMFLFCFFRGDVPMGRPHQLLHVSEPRVLNVAAWLMSCMFLLQLRCCQADVMQYARLKELKMPSEQDKAGKKKKKNKKKQSI